MLVQQPGPPGADVHRLEDPVAADGPKIVGSEDRGIARHQADAEESYHTLVNHAAQPNAEYDRRVTDSSLAQHLRSRGLRLTPQRQLVLAAVHRLGHATPDQVRVEVAKTAAGVNITTIYRTLELLERLGLVTHAHLSHGAPTYHAIGEEEHAHLVCRVCGVIVEVSPDALAPLAEQLARDSDFMLDIGHVALFGVCRGCGRQE